MAGLPATGTLKYGNFSFTGALKVDVKSQAVRDDADRTTLYRRLVVGVEFVVANDEGTDSDMETCRRELGEDRRPFILKQKGWGKLEVNTGGQVKDVNFGPKSEILTWHPLGAENACLVYWQCVICIPECKITGFGRYEGVMAINYSMSFDIDESGHTTRTTTGYLQIAQTAVDGDRRIHDTADRYRNKFNLHPLWGFHRHQSWAVDESKSRLRFTITDTEIKSPNPFPDGCIYVNGRHDVSFRSVMDGGDQRYNNTIHLDIERLKGTPARTVWSYFVQLVKWKKAQIERMGGVPFLSSIEVSEGLFDYRTSFRVSFFRTLNLKQKGDIASENALFGGALGFTWRDWSESMLPAQRNRGLASLSHEATQDRIVDLCQPATFDISGLGGQYPVNDGNSPTILNTCPPKNQSWYRTVVFADHQEQYNKVRHVILQDLDSASQLRGKSLGSDSDAPFDGGKPFQLPHIIHQSAPPTSDVTIYFDIIRICYQIPRPLVTRWGNQQLEEADSNIYLVNGPKFLNLRSYRLIGWIRYYVTNNAGNVTNAPRGQLEEG